MSKWSQTGTALALAVGLATSAGTIGRAGQDSPSRLPEPDRVLCQQTSAWAGTHPDSGRFFGGTWQEERKKLEWREYRSEAALDEVADGTVFNIAHVWRVPSGALFVRTQAWSGSGDWALYIDYCFRASGGVVRIDAELRELPGGTITKEAFEFDHEGKQLESRTTHYDLRSKAALAGEKAEEARGWKAIWPTPVYKQMRDLPFYTLLGQRK
jgi:hypothetical protein